MRSFVATVVLGVAGSLHGQEPAPYTPPEKLPAQSETVAQEPAKLDAPVMQDKPIDPKQAPPVKGQVLFERKEVPAVEGEPDAVPAAGESSSQPMPNGKAGPADADVVVSDDEREAVTFTAYDLDLHPVPRKSAVGAHVNFTVRNDGKVALTRVAVQISSSLAWDSLRVRTGTAAANSFVQHRINTDMDHTGVAREAVLTLAEPLKPGLRWN